VLAQAATAAETTKTPLLLVLAKVVGAAHDTGGLGCVVLAALPLPHGLAGRRGLGGRREEHLAGEVNDLSVDDNKAPVAPNLQNLCGKASTLVIQTGLWTGICKVSRLCHWY